ncbi:Hypothetical predicted protein [Lecanosticta acicola]|uniref:Pre-mRNA-splicing factor 38B n=1 Tax=Lecanosticta acicola TaxID=111012 RepID=A0AAI8W1M5_9PEZI|nr:Hypothetical predicted protein [Lecanosticta acicola]
MADTPLTDDYVAELLKKDAARTSNRFLTNSLGGLLSKPRGNAPKPNTRFLRNIVRDADTHNAALRRREEEESRARLRDLKRCVRRRDESSRKEEDPDSRRRRKAGLSPREKKHHHHHHSRRERSRDRKRSRSRSPRRGGERGHHRDRSRDRRHRRHANNNDDDEDDNHAVEERQHRRNNPEPTTSKSKRSPSLASDSDSDPLDGILGPKPPPPPPTTLPRGRGAQKSSSSAEIDLRFNDPNYDPKLDVGLGDGLGDGDGDDWDMALEALRDRAKWKKSGAERLRAAGFSEEEVGRFEESGVRRGNHQEGDISHVKWRKRGEAREWDRGKVMEGNHVDLKPEWGRLKDT